MPNTYRLNSHGMFDRRQDRNMRRVIFLSVEGTKTEVEYFGYINNSDYLQKARKYGHFTGYKN